MARPGARNRVPLFLALALLALLALGSAFYLVLGGGAADERPVVERSLGDVAVPVLRVPKRVGQPLQETDITIVFRRPEQVPEDAVLSPDLFRGRWVTRNMRPGEYIRETELARENAPTGYSGMIEPGERVVVLPTKDIEGVDGYLNVGDLVDITAALSGLAPPPPRPGSPATSGTQPGQRPPPPGTPQLGKGGAVVLLAVAARVVEVPQVGPPRRGQPDRQNVVLAVQDEEALRIQQAKIAGQPIRLAFRPFDEAPDRSTAANTLFLDPYQRRVRLLKGQDKSDDTVPRYNVIEATVP